MKQQVFDKVSGIRAVAWLSSLIPTLDDKKKYVIEIKQFRQKRSLDANAYCWVLIDKLAEKTGISKTDIYRNAIKEIGGKGTLFGLDRLKKHMLDYYKIHGSEGWILKCDISKFFYSIDHEKLKDIVDYYFGDEYLVWINHLFIDSTQGLGVPLGNQVAQVYALLMLHIVDCVVTGELGMRFYGRYMDDFFIIHHDKEYLKYCLEVIEAMVESLGLSLNSKTQIMPFRKGIGFLGFNHYVTSDGKYIRRLKGENKRRIKRKLRKWSVAVKDGKMTEKKFYEKYGAWKNHALHGNCIKLCQSMDLYVEKLMKE